MKPYLKLMRVSHYTKTLLVLMPLFCSGRLFHPEMLPSALLSFAAFALLSSVIYVINDIRDVEKDRLHPTKRKRPIASGAVSVRGAWGFAGLLFVLSMACNFAVFRIGSTLVLLVYLGINLGYCFGLKDYPMLDLAILTLGSLLRPMYGSLTLRCDFNPWMVLFILCLILYFTLDKRKNERRRAGNASARAVLQYYPVPFLEKSVTAAMALCIVFYALWCRDATTLALPHGGYLVWTVPIMIFCFLKCSMISESETDGDPIDAYLHDRTLVILFALLLVVGILLVNL